ncbi:hypothetical protein MFIFM68171_00088 [Madurella fahalii]|uniref:Uncharacterized protein n=1 Tax=Madurella fahalii TaxID=1157608 RepID=A0ABQ0FWK4_9PEZI
MHVLVPRITPALPRAAALQVRTFVTCTSTIDTLRARRKPAAAQDPPSGATTPSSTTHQAAGALGQGWTHWETPSRHQAWTAIDERTRSFYSTQIYHGQTPGGTGAGTGVLISAQMFGAEVKGNPTESEADVAADRSDDDPLPQGLHHTIRLPAGDAGGKPTESEEDVAADCGAVDPLMPGMSRKK